MRKANCSVVVGLGNVDLPSLVTQLRDKRVCLVFGAIVASG